ncbi:hypothetical protein B5M10_06740 [Pluralibacter gergoviae]|uniref:Csu type fimbrial protein n=1 Tax=Pluralibacter gergoviae TaxID=61647 RepID=UPI00069F61C9|nr:spore coat U domain-containing protein [Pluralibacter gergoviae]EKV0932220.1 spore coat protein U domain-containing protein [Pluralibacter gergoviae]EKV6248565.1 spore coat protein U domain-containing protein [Pluralibacter gergoviae]EKW9967476.1 spore coat protein U domain-containing protein [Pluralibacter gergoviae]ELD4273142.1 spore coat protein U domain-containing protein [Pluralibacter gergoviae]ELD4278696.1 spore coat protein U domain-containing protein [Pluralibacter gergoviae]
MSVIKQLLSAGALLLAGTFGFSFHAHADLSCWMGGHAVVNFGDIASGASASQPFDTDLECMNSESDGKTRWVRVCVSLDTDTPTMVMDYPYNEIFYNFYENSNPGTPLGKNNFASTEVQLPSQNNGQIIPVLLKAKIEPHQRVPTGVYHDYATTNVLLHYDFNENKGSLQKCEAMSGKPVVSQISAVVTVINGCDLINVDPMNFGSKSAVEGSQLTAAAVSGITLRCPPNTNFTLSMDMGQHSNGTTRQMCKDKECIAYGLYQDSTFSTPWDDKSNKFVATSKDAEEKGIPVYGQVPPQNWPSAGEYEDTVVVTLNY